MTLFSGNPSVSGFFCEGVSSAFSVRSGLFARFRNGDIGTDSRVVPRFSSRFVEDRAWSQLVENVIPAVFSVSKGMTLSREAHDGSKRLSAVFSASRCDRTTTLRSFAGGLRRRGHGARCGRTVQPQPRHRAQLGQPVWCAVGPRRAAPLFDGRSADSFSLDFHTIPYRGDEAELENHYVPLRGKACPSVPTFFAQERNSRVLCYANANLTRDTQAGELRKFVQFWRDVAGKNPQWLYFDSKLAPYAELSWLNEQKICFATIRRRGSAVLRRLASLPDSQWRSAVIDIPKRRHQHIEYVDERLRLPNYGGEARQVAVRGLGRETPTLFLSNHLEISPRDLVMNYARRNGIEEALGSSVDFFHLDCLSSEVRLNVDLDTVLTVLAHGCYRWLATQLHGFGQAKPKSVYRKFVETSGAVEIEQGRRLVVSFDRRSHNPILHEAQLDKASPPIPWLSNLRVEFAYS